MAHQLEIGSEIGGYRLTGKLGRGGMGTVYTAERISDRYAVALKVLAGDLGGSSEFRRRFVREAAYARSVDHPNVVRILDSGDEGGVLWAAMDLIEGRDLAAILAAEGPLDPRRALMILGQAAEALDAVHAAGLLHRDVKAANVLVERADIGERAFLTDFGLGKNPGSDSRALTAAGYFVGTCHYCAPEQILARDDIDHRVDIYSLGCLLFECLVGEPPFLRDREPDILRAHLDDPPPRPSERIRSLPAAIDQTVAAALEKDPKARYESAQALINAAEAALSPLLTPAPKETPSPIPQQASASAQTGDAGLKLEIVRGGNPGSAIEVTNELLIGREAPGAGRLADDPEISRRHARIWRDVDRGWTIEDLGSTNGSFVNGRRISSPQPLAEDDTVDVGTTTLRVAAARSPAAEAQPPAPEPSEPTPQASRVAPSAANRSDVPAPPLLSLRLEIDLEGREARISLDDASEPVRLVYEDGRWRISSS